VNSSRILLVLTAAALLATGVAAAAPVHSRKLAACATNEGLVLAYLPMAGRSCSGGVSFHAHLKRGETTSSGNPGQFTFSTQHLDRCIEFRDTHGSSDILLPSNGVAIQHLSGKTWCRHLETDRFNKLRAVGAVINTGGTILGIDSTKKGSLVKVTDGSITAVSTATGKRVTMGAGQQVFIPANGPPQDPQSFNLDDQDKEAAFLLQFNVLSMGLKQPAEYLKAQQERTIVVIAQDSAAAKVQTTALRGVKLLTLSAAKVNADPKVALAAAQKVGARTIVVTGVFTALQPTLENLAGVLPPEIALLFASPSG
jgi:hypothetical protein